MLQPVGASPDAKVFFETFLAAPILIVSYLFWKFAILRGKGPLYVRSHEMDVLTGLRTFEHDQSEDPKQSLLGLPKRVAKGLIPW